MKRYWVYILSSQKNGTLYIGCTNDIVRRIYEHKAKITPGFTSNYNVSRVIHAEEYPTVHEAIHREKCLKKWKREWKIELINNHNPDWVDLYEHII